MVVLEVRVAVLRCLAECALFLRTGNSAESPKPAQRKLPPSLRE